MPADYLTEIKERISRIHEGDIHQLDVILSDENRVIVEAPAGYGKTMTMVSRIAYLYASGQIPNPKRILGLTFSVNAALKIKRDIAAKLPFLLGQANNPVALTDKMTITNYHGFCKSILSKYGFLISDSLRRNVNLCFAVGDDEIIKYPDISSLISTPELQFMTDLDSSIKCGGMPSDEEIYKYNDIVVKNLLPREYITHNAEILLVIELFKKHEKICAFYRDYYPLIIVDEFQDTNCIAWNLLMTLITGSTKLLFLGDSLQRIYGFIGALPSLMENTANRYSMKRLSLAKNYRFRNNAQMLQLDANIRLNAQFGFTVTPPKVAEVPAFWGKSPRDEYLQVVSKVTSILESDANSKVALLLRGRKDVEVLEEVLQEANIEYFYGMFKDDDREYINYHDYCQRLLIKNLGNSKYATSRSMHQFTKEVIDTYSSEDDRIVSSLHKLLNALIEKISVDYSDLQPAEKYDYLLDIFENRQLKQAMEYVDAPIILSTIHGAKGLEWDYVFIVDLEIWGMPGYQICKDCPNKFDKTSNSRCLFPNVSNTSFREELIDELSVFYVATTRARKQVYFSASQIRANGKSGKYSCFASMPGIKIVDAYT